MDHARPRAHRSRADAAVDLGNEPPLSVDGGTGGVIDRRRVSVQWFSGTILTGVCGAALMGGAVFASLDGETNFATMPERIESTLRGAIGAISDKLANRKSDRLPPAGESNASRQVLRVSTTTKVGDREVVRVRPFVRVSANLTLSSTEFAASMPPFNPQKLLALAGADGVPADDQPGAEPDAEVSYVTRDLAGVLPRAKIASALPIDDIIARVRDTANWTGGTQNRYQVASLPQRQRAARLCRRRHARSLRRLRDPHRAREHHAAAQDRQPGHRRQRLERALGHRQEGRQHRDRSCRSSARRPRRSRRSPRRSARAAATTA